MEPVFGLDPEIAHCNCSIIDQHKYFKQLLTVWQSYYNFATGFFSINLQNMTWKQVFTSSIGKKITMALTGIFLITFLIVHVGLNACIWATLI